MKNKIILTLIFILLVGSSAFAAGTFYLGGKKQTLSGSTDEVQAGYYDHQLLTTTATGLTSANIKAGTTLFGITGTYGTGGMLPPTLTTTAATNITGTTASSGGNISTDGGSPVTARGVCWSTSTNPTIANSKTIDGTGTGIFPSSITGLTVESTYYVRAYATNSVGTAYGNEVSFTTTRIGESYGGGIIFYTYDAGQHGLIAAPSDQSSAVVWSNITNTYIGTTGTAIGSGESNTNAIIGQPGHTGGAAKLCYDLLITSEGTTYSDWFLPSKDELNLMYTNLRLAGLGGFADDGYWSSTEDIVADSAWGNYFHMTGGGSHLFGKQNTSPSVRAVRKF